MRHSLLKIAKKSENGRIGLVSSSIDAELNGEQFIILHQHSLSDDFSSYSALKFTVDRVVVGRRAARKSRPESKGRWRGVPAAFLDSSMSVSCGPVTRLSEGGLSFLSRLVYERQLTGKKSNRSEIYETEYSSHIRYLELQNGRFF